MIIHQKGMIKRFKIWPDITHKIKNMWQCSKLHVSLQYLSWTIVFSFNQSLGTKFDTKDQVLFLNNIYNENYYDEVSFVIKNLLEQVNWNSLASDKTPKIW